MSTATGQPAGAAFDPEYPWFEALACQETGRAEEIIANHRDEVSPHLVEALYQAVVTYARIDLHTAARFAQASEHTAVMIDDPLSIAIAHRAQGHVAFLTGDHRGALQHHRKAVEIFEGLHEEVQAARGRMNLIQPLIYLGQYDEAYEEACAARSVFLAKGDRLRVARLDVNLANVFYRQDRLSEALALYQSARSEIEASSDKQDLAVLLRNLAVCHTTMNNFDQAAATYRQARDISEANGFPLLVAEADYNVAYLHFLRGEYTLAIELYQTARQLCVRLNNRYHMALCDLDLAELYLELNMAREGGQLANAAVRAFDAIGMNYERAKAIAFSAISASQAGENEAALRRFAEARAVFVSESNSMWPGLIDFYRALVLLEQGCLSRSAHLARAALRTFIEDNLQTKAAIAKTLLARIALQQNQPERAIRYCQRALARLRTAPSPAIEFHAISVLSAAEERIGRADLAYASLQRANLILEDLRSQILGEAFRIGFLKDKLSIYGRLSALALQLEPPPDRSAKVFDYVERAKSRTLADLISLGTQVFRTETPEPLPANLRLEDLRQRMTMAYRQAVRTDFQPERDSVDRFRRYRERSQDFETAMEAARTGPEARDHRVAALLSAGALSLDEVQANLAPETAIVEYFECNELLQAAVLHRGEMRVIPLCSWNYVLQSLNLFQFQLARYELGTQQVQRFHRSILAATNRHLAELYAALIRPLELPSTASHLVIVPHGCLHALPFHALLEGTEGPAPRALMDVAKLSYAPSASVYTWCRKSEDEGATRSLILGIPDSAAPSIRDEVIAVADLLPDSRLFVGSTATRQILWQAGPQSRFIHIATHGLFRRDNPMFSSVRLGDTDLHPVDFYSLQLNARLVTLSGCGTGLNAIVGGDEILGLVRGLLYAGARAVLVSLWNVNDAVTSSFMKVFYREMMDAPTLSAALHRTMQSIRAIHPHPAYWAPFVLIGDAESAVFPRALEARHTKREG